MKLLNKNIFHLLKTIIVSYVYTSYMISITEIHTIRNLSSCVTKMSIVHDLVHYTFSPTF